MTDFPSQPNASLNVDRDGEIIRLTHMNRLGSRHVIPLSLESAKMLAEALLEECGMATRPTGQGAEPMEPRP